MAHLLLRSQDGSTCERQGWLVSICDRSNLRLDFVHIFHNPSLSLHPPSVRRRAGKHTAGSTVMQLCGSTRRWSFGVWLLDSSVALEDSGRLRVSVGSDSHWKCTRPVSSSSSSFLWSTELSLGERVREGRWKAKEGDGEKGRGWAKSCQQKCNNGQLSYFLALHAL